MIEKYLDRTDFSSYADFIENYKLNVPEDFNFGFDVVDGWAESEPGKRALVWCDDHGGDECFSFADISRMSNQAANMLAGAGIKKGDRVLLILRQRYEYWFTAVALHKIGAVLIPGSYQFTEKDVAYRVSSADVRLVIAVDDPGGLIGQVDKGLAEFPHVKKYIVAPKGERAGWADFAQACRAQSDKFARTDVRADDLMLLYFTSGTTGMPKMVAHDQTYPLGHITTAKYWQQVREDTLHFSNSDSSWAKFGWGKIYGQWIAGAAVMAYDFDKFVPEKMLRMIEKYKLTTFCVPPTMYRFLMKEDLSKYDLSSIKHAGTAGEALTPEIFNQFHAATGLRIHEGFGQSESSVLLLNSQWTEPNPGSTGKPAPLYELDLIDEDGNSVPVGEEGEIVVKNLDKYFPVGLFKGYFENGQVNKSCFDGGVYHTGDVAWRDINGYYWFVGRNDDMIKCSGYRIGPFEVESALQEHPAVLESAITGFPDEVRGQIVKATIVLASGYAPSDELVKELQNHVKRVTAPYKYPRIIEFVDELPKTLSNKIKRKEIREGRY